MKTLKEYFINEAKKLKREEILKNIKEWIDDISKNGNKLNDNIDFPKLETIIRNYFLNQVDYSSLGLGISDKDLICDISGYIIEAAVYDAFKSNYDVTSRAGRGLKFDNQSVYWDFSIKGLDEKFEVKAKCKNGYHTGGITKTDNQRNDKNLIYIIIPYTANENGFIIDTNNIKVKR